MAVQLIEGFEAGSLDVGFGYYGSSQITTTTAGPWSRYAYANGQQNLNLLYKSSHTEEYGAVRYYVSSLVNYEFIDFFNINGNMVARLKFLASGLVQIQDSTQTVQGTSTNIYYPNSFNLVEWYLNTATGACKLRLHGSTTDEFSVASGGDYDPGTGVNALYGLSCRTGSGSIWDDIIVYDTSGAQWNSWVGDKCVTGITPNATGAQNDWAPMGSTSGQRYYFAASTGLAASPAPNGQWERKTESGFTRATLSPIKTGASTTGLKRNNVDQQAVGDDTLVYQFISPALAAQTISGTFKMQAQAQEEYANLDHRSQVVIWVVKPDGSSRGVLYAGDTGSLTSEWNTSRRNVKFPQAANSPGSLSSLAVTAGDRLVVEVGYRDGTDQTATGWNTGIYLGDTGASGDLPEDETTTTTTYIPWIEFSGTINLAGGSNWDYVDEAGPDDDGTYVATSTDNAMDLYSMSDVPSAVSVTGPLVIKARAKKTDPGSRTLQLPYKVSSGAVQYPTALPVPTGGYVYVKTYLDVDGTGGAAWDDTKVNGLQVGLKATT